MVDGSDASVIISVRGLGKEYFAGEMSSFGSVRDAVHGLVNHGILRRPREARPGARERFWAIRDVTFDVRSGEVVGIIGPNGAGKSTLLKVLSRVTLPTEGTAELVGRIGSLLEVGTGFHPDLTGRENVYFSGAVLGMKRDEVRRKFDEIVAFSGVARFIDTPIKHYSSGMQVRLGFAVAAHLEPEVLIIDEVLAVGDEEFQRRCLRKIEDVAADGLAVLLVSHNMTSVARLCHTAHVFDGGRLVDSGPVEKVIQGYRRAAADRSPVRDGSRGVVTAQKWRVVGEPCQQPHAARVGEPLSLAIDVEIDREVDRAVFLLEIALPDGAAVWRGTTEHDVGPTDLTPGPYNLIFDIAEMPVRSGSYVLVLSARSNGSVRPTQQVRLAPDLELGSELTALGGAAEPLLSIPYRSTLISGGIG